MKTHLITGDVTLGNYTAVGSNAVVMPRNIIPEGAVIGALSFVPTAFEFQPWSVYAGTPIRFIRARNKESVMVQVRSLEAQLEARRQQGMSEKIPWWRPEIGAEEYPLIRGRAGKQLRQRWRRQPKNSATGSLPCSA